MAPQLESVLWKIAIAAVIWVISWYFVYVLSGFHIRSISISNGFKIHGVSYRGRFGNVAIGTVIFKGWFRLRTVVFEDITVVITSISKKSTPATTSGGDDLDDVDYIDKDPRANEIEVSILPKNKWARIVVSFVLTSFRSLGVELRHLSVSVHGHNVADVQSIQCSVKSKRSTFDKDKLKINSILTISNLNQLNDKPDPVKFLNLSIKLSVSVNSKSGSLSDLIVYCSTDEVVVSVFTILKARFEQIYVKNIVEKELVRRTTFKESDNIKIDDIDNEELKSLNKFYKMVNQHNRFHHIIDKLSLHLENTTIQDIPFETFENNILFEQYLKSSLPTTSLDLKIKSLSFNISKLHHDDAGFKILFDSQSDQPFHLTNNLQLLTIDYKSKHIHQNIVNVPNLSITFKSNISHQLATGHGFKDAIVELFASASSPIIDVTTKQLSEIIYNFVLVSKYNYIKKLTKIESSCDSAATKILKQKYFDLLKEYYPRLDARIIIEQPRFLLHHDDTTSVFNFSYDMLEFQVFTTKSWQYNSKCAVTNTLCSIYEHTVAKYNLFDAELVQLNLNFSKNFKLTSKLILESIAVDLSKLTPLSLINEVLVDIYERLHRHLEIGAVNGLLNSIIDEKSAKILYKFAQPKTTKPSAIDRIFDYLPLWFASFEIDVNSLELFLGSRSILIPPNEIFNTEDDELRDDHIGESQQLRNVKVSFDEASFAIRNGHIQNHARTDKVPEESDPSFLSVVSSSDKINEIKHTKYWTQSAVVSNFEISILNDLTDTAEHSSFLLIPLVDLSILSLDIQKLKIELIINKFIGNYDRFKLFTIVGAFRTLKHILISPIKSMIRGFEKDNLNFDSTVHESNRPKVDILNLIDGQFEIQEFVFTLNVGEDFGIKLQLMQLDSSLHNHEILLSLGAIRVLTESPVVKDKWTRLLFIDSLRLKTSLKKLPIPDIFVTCNAIILIHPHQFIVYKLFDNLSVTIKCIKYFVSVLNHPDIEKIAKEVYPKVMKPLALPNVNLKSGQLSFRMEDDPFESELNMIYQLGLIEQRKRLEQINLFETKLASIKPDTVPDNIEEMLFALHSTMSKSWIRKVKVYKAKLRNEVLKNKKHLYGNEGNFDRSWNNDVQPYSIFAPLLLIQVDKLDLNLSKPKFDLSKLPDFMSRVGQGVPKDRTYSLLVPCFLKLKLAQLRMHLRDYPLPFVHIPALLSEDTPSVVIEGNLVIGEEFTKALEHTRKVHVPFVPGESGSTESKFFSLELYKSLSTVKLYTDMKIEFNSDMPSRFVIGCSYQFAIQQFMVNFDQFSKPPVDPSLKLGVWDKLRLIMHGKFEIRVKNNLEVAFKGSRDPYNLFEEAAGFVLGFSDNVVWTINGTDNSKDFFKVKSDKVSWYIPNYIGNPLPCWTRETSKSINLVNSTSFVTSCFGYYLDEGIDSRKPPNSTRESVVDRIVVQLSGGVDFDVGFLLQRTTAEGELSTRSIPHHEVKLYNPQFISDGHDSYKGFRSDYISMIFNLRANKETNYNSLHLSTRTFKSFFSWWKLFASNMMLPIRKSKIFGEFNASPKFSQHLLHNIFAFHVKSLFVAHTFRDDVLQTEDNDVVECFGIRGKMDDFFVDIHQRREPQTIRHEGLSRVQQVNKMNFHMGEIHLGGIDLRVVNAKFKQNIYESSTDKDNKQTYETYDNDKRWFDKNDYEETGAVSLKNCPGKIYIFPLLYAKRFSYLRNTGKDEDFEASDSLKNDFIHDCTISSKNYYLPQLEVLEDRIKQLQNLLENETEDDQVSNLTERMDLLKTELEEVKKQSRNKEDTPTLKPKENFNNIFTLLNTFFKWNAKNRNSLLKYIHQVQINSFYKRFVNYESIRVVDEIINREVTDDISTFVSDFGVTHNDLSFHESNEFSTCNDRLNNFETVLTKLSTFQSISADYQIEIINPQIQLQSQEDPDSVIIIAAPRIDSKIYSIYNKSDHELVANSKVLETRLGWLIKDASILILNKNTAVNKNGLIINDHAYGSKSNWPPWLGIEICRNGSWAGKEHLLVEKLSLMFTYDKITPFGISFSNTKIEEVDDDSTESSTDEENKMMVPVNRFHLDVPQLVVTTGSDQYFVFYEIITDLLFYTEPKSKTFKEKLEKLKFSINFHELSVIKSRLDALNKHLRILEILVRNYGFRRNHLSNAELNDFLLIKNERIEVIKEIYLLVQSVLKGENYKEDSSSNLQDSWQITTDEIVLHLLEDDRSPLVSLSLSKSKFTRCVYEDGSNKNGIKIGMLQILNKIQKSRYPEILSSYFGPEDDVSFENLIVTNWTINRTIGGIQIIENLEVFFQPLNIQLDEMTMNKILKFALQTDLENLKDFELPSAKQHDSGDEDDSGRDSDNDDSEDSSPDHTSEKSTGESSSKGASFSKSSDKKSGLSILEDGALNDGDVEKMIYRSKKYVSVVNLKVHAFQLNISVDLNKGYKRLLNVQNFLINMAPIQVTHKTLSFMEFAEILKKTIISTLLNHTGKLIKNKISVKKNDSKRLAIKPLRSLSSTITGGSSTKDRT